jgi:hypothetical protein
MWTGQHKQVTTAAKHMSVCAVQSAASIVGCAVDVDVDE